MQVVQKQGGTPKGMKRDIALANQISTESETTTLTEYRNIIPVKLEIKEFSDKPNALYVVVSLEGIKKDEVVEVRGTVNGVAQISRSSVISIPDSVEKINPTGENSEKERITIAAPISISGVRYYMGVMVQRDINSQRLYLHDVIEDVVLLEEKEETSNTTSADLSSTGADERGTLFMTSIIQKALFGNPSDENSEKISRSISSASFSARLRTRLA